MTAPSAPTAGGRPRIVDFSTHLSGPLASHLLRDLGADVIKVEHPVNGDGLRTLLPLIAGTGKFHAAVNVGARSLAISPKSPHWSTVVAACARWADAVIVGSRPVDARRRGIDFATLHQIDPELVYCSISGYGDRGPWSGYAAHGQNPDGMAGLVPVTWAAGMPTTPAGYRSAGTPLAGVFAALGIMGALYRREIGLPAPYVSVSLWGAAMWWNWRDLNLLENNGHGARDYQDFGSRYAMYPTMDDRAVIVCPIEQKFWERFCDVLALPDEWSQRGDWSGAHVDYGSDDERATIADRMRRRTLLEWISILEKADVPFAPVLTPGEALESEQTEAMQVMRGADVAGTRVRVMGSPVQLRGNDSDDVTRRPLGSTPDIGADNEALLTELGLGDLTDQSLKGS